MRQVWVLAVVAALVLVGCDGPGADAVFDEDASGDGASTADEPTEAAETTSEGSGGGGLVVKGREDGADPVDLDAAAERACGRAVTESGRYSQTGYDRGVREAVDGGLDEAEVVAAIEELCGDRIAEARGD